VLARDVKVTKVNRLTHALSRLTAALADRYTIERELGAGGMATVYLAQDLRHHRNVAVRVLAPQRSARLGFDHVRHGLTMCYLLIHCNT
jgi:hypothetical protein